MNGLHTRLNLTLDADRQRENNRISHAGDRVAGIGALVCAAVLAVLMWMGVVP